MTRVAILAEIKTILESVTDIGIVHDSVRWVIEEQKFQEEFIAMIADQPQVRTWMITRVGGQEAYGPAINAMGTRFSIPTGTRGQRYDWQIEGLSAFTDDSSESDFQALMDSVLDTFKDEISLNSSALLRGPISYSVNHIWFGEFLVHHATISFYAVETSGITPT